MKVNDIHRWPDIHIRTVHRTAKGMAVGSIQKTLQVWQPGILRDDRFIVAMARSGMNWDRLGFMKRGDANAFHDHHQVSHGCHGGILGRVYIYLPSASTGRFSDDTMRDRETRRLRALAMAANFLIRWVWVPDTRAPGFAEEARRQSAAATASEYAKEDQAFVDAISVEWS